MPLRYQNTPTEERYLKAVKRAERNPTPEALAELEQARADMHQERVLRQTRLTAEKSGSARDQDEYLEALRLSGKWGKLKRATSRAIEASPTSSKDPNYDADRIKYLIELHRLAKERVSERRGSSEPDQQNANQHEIRGTTQP